MEYNHYSTHIDCQQALDEREVALDEHEWRIVEVFHQCLNNFHTSIVSNHRLVKRPHPVQAQRDFANVICMYSRMQDDDRDNDVVCPLLPAFSSQPSAFQTSWVVVVSSQK